MRSAPIRHAKHGLEIKVTHYGITLCIINGGKTGTCKSGFWKYPAIGVALFYHAYIWVHMYCTQDPDMQILYARDIPANDDVIEAEIMPEPKDDQP